MNDYKHKRKIALGTLENMTPTMAFILGGQSFEEAYKVVFNTELRPRLEQLIEEYGISCKAKDFSWEMDTYGWNPINLLKELDK